jgi:transketolase
MEYTAKEICDLKKRAAKLRSNLIDMIPPGKVGHLGGSSSIMDVVAALYFKVMHVYDDPKDPRRDLLVFSKGHAVLAQYAAFVELGYVEREALQYVKTLHCTLQGHPDMDQTPGIEAVTGSLGQGLSICLGMALGLRLDGKETRVYCIVGDGELAEGQIWEAAMAAASYKADNLCAIVDVNGVQATDVIEHVLANPDLKKKWEAFGWKTIEIDGHDIKQILTALEEAKATKSQPIVILAKTVKGKGFSFAEGKAAYHNAAMNDEEYAQAREMVKKMLEDV